jgi:hypothetical protein
MLDFQNTMTNMFKDNHTLKEKKNMQTMTAKTEYELIIY